jgi:protein ImuB
VRPSAHPSGTSATRPALPEAEAAPRTLVAWWPDWPVVAAGRPLTQPVAVVVANRVVACSPAARLEGVVRGLRRREAQARCPEVEIIPADPAAEARRWEPVVAAVETFTPGLEVLRPGVVAVPTRGPSRYFGGDHALAAKVAAAMQAAARRSAAKEGWDSDDVALGRCRVGVAEGRFAAELAARSALESDLIQVVPPGATPNFLSSLPIRALEAHPDLIDLLLRLGLRTLGAFASLPAPSVVARFGREGVEAHRLARGLEAKPLELRIPPPDWTVSIELDPPAERVDQAAFAGKTLADQLHARLGAEGLVCTRVGVEAETEHGERLFRLWRHDGALSAGAIAERVRWQLDGWLSEDHTSAGLTLLRLVPDEVHADEGRQLGFWGGAAAADQRASRALARVQGLLGPDGVVTAVLGGGRDHAEQVTLIPWGEPRQPARPGVTVLTEPSTLAIATAAAAAAAADPAGAADPQLATSLDRGVCSPGGAKPAAPARPGAEGPPPWPGRIPGPAPAVVHHPALPANLTDAQARPVGVTSRGVLSEAPVQLAVAGGRPVALRSWAGPWPLEEHWWDGGGRRRARLQVCTADGCAYLVVRESGAWWVEATYD